jgi:hypothetical protein
MGPNPASTLGSNPLAAILRRDPTVLRWAASPFILIDMSVYPRFKNVTTPFGSTVLTVTDGTTTVTRTVNQLLALIDTAYGASEAVTTNTVGYATTTQN